MTGVDSPMEAFDARTELALWWQSDGPDRLSQLTQGALDELGRGRTDVYPLHDDPARVAAYCERALRSSELYWVDENIAELARAASLSFPEIELRREEVPARSGIAMLAKPLQTTNEQVALNAMQWQDDGARLFVLCYFAPELIDLDADQRSQASRMFGRFIPSSINWYDYGTASDAAYLPSLRSLWAISCQRLASTHREHAGRSVLRRASRARLEFLPDVQVVHLRRQALVDGQEPGQCGHVDWSHRWIVGAHWRDQFYNSCSDCAAHGRACGAHPTWIAPYVKGPENKPLVADRMYAIDR